MRTILELSLGDVNKDDLAEVSKEDVLRLPRLAAVVPIIDLVFVRDGHNIYIVKNREGDEGELTIFDIFEN